MRIRWTPAAAADLQRISDYLTEHHPRYRDATIRKIYAALQSLKEWPYVGRTGREAGTRELLFPPLPYVAAYRVNGQTVKSCEFITALKTAQSDRVPRLGYPSPC
jgi:toxin ParE1/3/4